jgi:HSP20 family protein
MMVTRYRNPKFDLMNEFFKQFEMETEPKEIVDFTPAVNTREDADAYYIDVDLPGVKKDDVEISIDKNILTIKGERKVRNEVKEGDYYRIESAYGSFARSFTLPEKVDTENIEAKTENGVLEIVIPKLKVEKDTTKKIEIK